jgi:spermidine synthase
MSKTNFEPVTFSEINGVRYLHLGTPWVQGAMRIKKPYAVELEYAQQMMAWLLFLDPHHTKVLQLGLGTGTLTQFCHRLDSTVKTVAVELNPAVIVAAQTMFGLETQSPRISVIQSDALQYVKTSTNHQQFDAIQVDVFNGEASGPAINSREFYQGCFDTLKAPGVMTVNLFSRHASFSTNINHICDAFHNRVLLFQEVHDCNVVAVAFKGPQIQVDWQYLEKRALFIQKQWGLKSKAWVKHLKKNNVQSKQQLII